MEAICIYNIAATTKQLTIFFKYVPDSTALFGGLVLIASEDLAQIILPVIGRGPHSTVVGVYLTSDGHAYAPEYDYPL